MMEECCRICGECISSKGFALCVRVQGTVPELGEGDVGATDHGKGSNM